MHSQPSSLVNGRDGGSHSTALKPLNTLANGGQVGSEMGLDNTNQPVKSDLKYNYPPIDADPPKAYIVIQSTSHMLAAGIWDTVRHAIKGVYQSKKDANNKVLSLYQQVVGDRTFVRHQIRLWNKGEGSPYYHWETGGEMIDNCHVRVHVEEWAVISESNQPEKFYSLIVI
jgi:hypothetical protein